MNILLQFWWMKIIEGKDLQWLDTFNSHKITSWKKYLPGMITDMKLQKCISGQEISNFKWMREPTFLLWKRK